VPGFSVYRVVVGDRKYWVAWEVRTRGIGIEVVGIAEIGMEVVGIVGIGIVGTVTIEVGIVVVVVVGIAETIDIVEVELADAIEVDYFDIFLGTEIVDIQDDRTDPAAMQKMDS
jgi:hypothetical protein